MTLKAKINVTSVLVNLTWRNNSLQKEFKNLPFYVNISGKAMPTQSVYKIESIAYCHVQKNAVF